MRIAGIDWATEKKNRALVILEVTADGPVSVQEVRPSLADEDALKVCEDERHSVVAIDIPFGWPSRFSRFVSAWSPTVASGEPSSSDEFRFRCTDRVVKAEVPKEPLSVSADRIAMGARAWAVLLAKHALWSHVDVEGKPSVRSPVVIEVYPGASAVVLGKGRPILADEESYKNDAAVRRSLVQHVASLVNVSLGRFTDDIVSQGKDSDETDAFLAAVTGLIYGADRLGFPTQTAWKVRCPVNDGEIEAARTEGWIFFPVSKETDSVRTAPWRSSSDPREK